MIDFKNANLPSETDCFPGEFVGQRSGLRRALVLNRVLVEGKPQTLSPILQDEVYRISREVIRNAFEHADASQIEVEIRYSGRQLRLRIRDDGKGIDPKILEAGGKSGHWGIPGCANGHSDSGPICVFGARWARAQRWS